MLDSQWVLLVLLAGFAAHALVLFAAHRRLQAAATTDATATDSATVVDGTVDCPDCGTANDADYRYCGGCAQQLPHAGPLDQQNGGPRSSLFG